MDVNDPRPSQRSLRGLDWLNFFLADIRTGVGPFVAIYLASNHWSETRVGVALTAAEFAGVLTQAPGGAVADRFRSKRALVLVALLVLAASALAMARFPNAPIVIASQLALGATGSVFGPGISAITLGLVGYRFLGVRTGRNAGFGSAGNVVAAASMGAIGYFFGIRSIFFLVAILAIPTIICLSAIRGAEIDYERARGGGSDAPGGASPMRWWDLFRDRRLVVFSIFTVLFHLANGAMIPMTGQMFARAHAQQSAIFMSALVIVPQIVMAAIGPSVGRWADEKGRKPILVFGFLFLPLRALLFALTSNPYVLTAGQVFDGIAAGIFGIVGVLIIADCTQGTGHYNLALGLMGMAVGIGASISTTMAGFVAQRFGYPASFLALGASGLLALAVLWRMMPETKDASPSTALKETDSRPAEESPITQVR